MANSTVTVLNRIQIVQSTYKQCFGSVVSRCGNYLELQMDLERQIIVDYEMAAGQAAGRAAGRYLVSNRRGTYKY